MQSIIQETLLLIGMILVLILLFRNNKQNGQVSITSGILTGVLLYYFTVPFFIFLLREEAEQSGRNSLVTIVGADGLDVLLAILRVLVFLFTYLLVNQRYNNRRMRITYTIAEDRLVNVLKFFVWTTFLIGGGSFLLYISAFGGLKELLYYAEYLRSFATNATRIIPYLASIMVIPARLITVTPILILVLLGYRKKDKFTLVYILMFVISFFGAVAFCLANAGRALLITYGICFVIPLLQKVIRKPWRLTFAIGIISLPILDYLDALFIFFQTGKLVVTQSSFISYLRQFSFPFANVLNQWKIVEKFGIRYCQDFITGVLNIIPGVNFQPSYEVTSAFYGGELWKRAGGGIPNDIVTFGYIEFGILGVFLVAMILGIVSGKMDRLLLGMDNRFSSNVLRTTVIVSFFCLVFNADIVSIVRSQFLLTIPCICLLYASRRNP